MGIDAGRCSCHRSDAGDADGDVGLALAPRPAERVADDHGDVDPELGEPVRGSGAPRRRGPAAAPRPGPAAPLDDWSTPLLAHTKPWWVSVISTGPTHPHDAPRLAQHDLDDPLASLSHRAAHSAAKSDGVTLSSSTMRPFGLRHDLRRDDHDVAVGELGSARDDRAARSSPGSISGRPSTPRSDGSARYAPSAPSGTRTAGRWRRASWAP